MKLLRLTLRLLPVASLLTPTLWAQPALQPTQESPAAQQAPAATPALSDSTEQPASTAPVPASVGTKVLPAPDRTTPIGGTITGLLASGTAVSKIQQQDFDQREPLLGDIAARVSAVDKQLSETRVKAPVSELSNEEKQVLEKSWSDYQGHKSKLEQDLQTARTGERAQWERVRSTLATDYAFYAAAVAAVEVAAP